MQFMASKGGDIIGYSNYKKLMNNTLEFSDFKEDRIILANVSYMYNYEGAQDDGYYWVDSYDNSVIDFIPPEPQREGYIFGGWYKEAECVNAWDFETDKTGRELLIDDETLPYSDNTPVKPPQYDENDGIRLYAKWIKQ